MTALPASLHSLSRRTKRHKSKILLCCSRQYKIHKIRISLYRLSKRPLETSPDKTSSKPQYKINLNKIQRKINPKSKPQ